MPRLLLTGLLRACLAVALRPRARADREPGTCRDAAPGEWCHAAVTWAKESGHERRPDWFPGDAGQYSLQDFQALLHQLGEAECPRPCPAGSRGKRPALGLLQLQSAAASQRGKGRAAARRRGARGVAGPGHGLSPAELAAVAEATWRPGRRAGRREAAGQTGAGQQAGPAARAALGAGDSETDSETSCQDAQPGSMCYHAAAWLLDEGVAKHPKWYPSLSAESNMQEVQSVLHDLGKAHCPRPCPTRAAKRLARSPDDRVLEVDGSGRQVLSEAYEVSGPTACGTAQEGDWCYISIMWLKSEGLQRHPDWYPALSHESSIEDFQAVLHKGGKVSCPLPCTSNSTAPRTPAPPKAVVSRSAMTVNAEMEDCKDAKKGSNCYKAITRIIDVGLQMHPEEYPELAAGCSRQEVQEHLYLRRQHQCDRPCPQQHVDRHMRQARVQKSVEDMTAHELTRFLNNEWDGYVDSDEYTDAAAAYGATEPGSGEETLPVANDETDPDPFETQGRSAWKAVGECRDAAVGEPCHKEVAWAQAVGILEHPKWYPGLSASSTFKEIQAFIHKTRGGLCQLPCPGAAEGVLERAPAARVLEEAQTDQEPLPVVDDDHHESDLDPFETQGSSAGDSAGACRDAAVGEPCHKEVAWAQAVGILEHPKWYPGLSASSTFKEIQAFVHRTRGRLCRMPCPDAAEAPAADEGAAAEERSAADAAPAAVARGAPSEGAARREAAANDAASRTEAREDEAHEDLEAQPEKPAAGEAAAGRAAQHETAGHAGPGAADASSQQEELQEESRAEFKEVPEDEELASLRAENARLRAEAEALRARQQAGAEVWETLPVVDGNGQETLTAEAARILLAANGARAVVQQAGAERPAAQAPADA